MFTAFTKLTLSRGECQQKRNLVNSAAPKCQFWYLPKFGAQPGRARRAAIRPSAEAQPASKGNPRSSRSIRIGA
jgi:hypothetical protein